MPRWLKILLGIVGGFVVVIAAIVWIALSATSGLVEPIDRQLAALKSGNVDAAYAETSDGFRQATSLEQFGTFVQQYPILKDYASYSFSSRSFENNVGKVSGTLTASAGAVTTIDYQMVYERETWKIHGISLNGG